MGVAPSIERFAHHNILTQKELEQQCAKHAKMNPAQRRAQYVLLYILSIIYFAHDSSTPSAG